MHHEISPASGRLTKTHVHTLNKGAVITQGLSLNPDIRYRPGDIIQLETEDDQVSSFLCRILDIESVKSQTEANVLVRVTLEKAN
jgi:hypothetical protein